MDLYILNIVYLIHAVLAVVLLIYAIKSGIKCYGVGLSIKRVKNLDDFIFSLKCSFGLFGEQGVGKSLLMTYIILTLQPSKFLDLQYEYYRELPKRELLLEQARNGRLFDWKLFNARKESLDFYVKNIDEYIPCVYAFKEQQIFKGGRKSYELKKAHFTQSERLPENNLLACDEFGDRFNNTARRKDLNKVNISDDEMRARIDLENTFKMSSTHRQVSNGFMVLADQRKGDISIAFKSTCSKKWYLLSMEEKYTAEAIVKIRSKLKTKIRYYGNLLEHKELLRKVPKRFNPEKAEKKLKKLCKLDNFLLSIERKIGFFKIGYCEENGSEEVATLNKRNIEYICIPRNLDYKYNSRGYLLTDPTVSKTLHV